MNCMSNVRTGMNGLALGTPLLDEIEELLGHHGAGVDDLLGASLGSDIHSAIRPLDSVITRGLPPRLDLGNLGVEESIFGGSGLLSLREELESVGGGGQVHRGHRVPKREPWRGGQEPDGTDGRRNGALRDSKSARGSSEVSRQHDVVHDEVLWGTEQTDKKQAHDSLKLGSLKDGPLLR